MTFKSQPQLWLHPSSATTGFLRQTVANLGQQWGMESWEEARVRSECCQFKASSKLHKKIPPRDTSPNCCCSVAQSCLSLCNPTDAACRAPLSSTSSWSLLRLMSIESVMPFNHLVLCCPLLLLPSIFPSIRVFSSESALHIRWPKYWSFSFSISPSKGYSGLIS